MARGKKAKAVPFGAGLGRALQHWRRYYEHQMYERRFVEGQSGLPFPHWQAMTARMATLLPQLLLGEGAQEGEEDSRSREQQPSNESC